MKHSIRSFYDAAGVSIVGNVAYLSNKPLLPSQLGKLAKWLPQAEWFQKIASSMNLSAPTDGAWRSGWLALEILHLCMKDGWSISHTSTSDPFYAIRSEFEPDWMKHLPRDAQRYLRCGYAQTDGIDPLAIVLKFPYMGFGYILPDYGMAAEAAQVFHLHRLGQVKQLSFLHDPVLKGTDRGAGSLMFEHTRYCHSLDVHAVANVIAHNLGIRDAVVLNTLVTAAETHDALTPAGGDSVKLVDPQAFDEDAHYPEMLVGPEWERYRDQYRIDPMLLVETIKGNGLLGRILDVADKSSYLARDVLAYLGSEKPQRRYADTGYTAIASIVKEDPFVCALWESARLYKGSLVFKNIDRMARFLTLRALMFRELYYNPYSRFFEYLIGKGVVKYLYDQGLVTREQLLRENDWWIERKIEETLESPFVLRQFHNLDHARIEEHPDRDAAVRRMTEFDNDDSAIVILDDFQPVTTAGTRKFLVWKDGQAMPFCRACPEEADDIESIMKTPKVVRLYFFAANDLDIPRESRVKIKRILRSVVAT